MSAYFAKKIGLHRALIVFFCSLSFVLSTTLHAAQIDIIYVGTWSSVGSGNPLGSGGPGMSAGQKFVVKISYDDLSAVNNNVPVPDSGFNPSGNFMSTIDLSAPGNSLDIFVPMEGLDGSNPFIYNQNETNHFWYGPNSTIPTLNFVNGSSISNTANIIGLEFEGDFFPGAGDNLIELFNTAPPNGVTSMQAQVLNLGTGIAAAANNPFTTAVNLVVDAGPDIVYNASSLIQTANASVTQSNNLGSGRSDGEDFVDFSWSPSGTPVGDNNQVGIADSGLTMTTSTTTWTATGTEQMTGLSASDTTNVSYQNALPTVTASAIANTGSIDFTLNANDADLAVNSFISGFEMLSFAALLDGVSDATAFFSDLFANGIANYTNLQLFNAFGAGSHNVLFTVMDKAGATVTSTVDFVVDRVNSPNPVPTPGVFTLLLVGLLSVFVKRRFILR